MFCQIDSRKHALVKNLQISLLRGQLVVFQSCFAGQERLWPAGGISSSGSGARTSRAFQLRRAGFGIPLLEFLNRSGDISSSGATSGMSNDASRGLARGIEFVPRGTFPRLHQPIQENLPRSPHFPLIARRSSNSDYWMKFRLFHVKQFAHSVLVMITSGPRGYEIGSRYCHSKSKRRCRQDDNCN